MSSWHDPENSGRCSVCLAGAVMAYSLKYPVNCVGSPIRFVEKGFSVYNKLYAINCFRLGYILEGLRQMNITCRSKNGMPVARYENNPAQFKKDMRAIIKYLKSIKQ